ncbi:MAG: glucoamylase family protein [Candidatus Entotheonellia bacterium]
MNRKHGWNRREVLRWCGSGLLVSPLIGLAGCHPGVQPPASLAASGCACYTGTDDQLLDDIQRASFAFFWDEAPAATGQVKDRALANGGDTYTVSSIAATGFGLTALCIADARGYRPTTELKDRTRKTLQFIANMPHKHGFFYHFIDMHTGACVWDCEVSSIDTSLLLAGVLTARQHFNDQQIKDLATMVYERVDWPWMLNGGRTLSMGWKPESGFLRSRWDHYCELMMIYLLAYGSPSHPLDPKTWEAWTRPTYTYDGITYISAGAPLFTHQYSHAWYDFRNKRDAYADYYDNSVKATEAHKRFCLFMRDKYPTYSEDLWGITASDSQQGYTDWRCPPAGGPIKCAVVPCIGDAVVPCIDGSVVPCAAGGSLPFAFNDCMRVMRTLRGPYAHMVWKKYGFVDVFNPMNGWVNPDVIGIDVGITMVMAENARTGFVWDTFMKNSEAQVGMQKAGFKPVSP